MNALLRVAAFAWAIGARTIFPREQHHLLCLTPVLDFIWRMSDPKSSLGTAATKLKRDQEELLMTTFDQVISTMAQLEELCPEPVYPPAKVKEAIRITKAYRALIEASPFCVIATSGPGGLDCSPRGDPKGFVRVIDEKTIAVPDRRGNNRIDSLRELDHRPAHRADLPHSRASARQCASWVAQRSRPIRSCARVSPCRARRRAAYS